MFQPSEEMIQERLGMQCAYIDKRLERYASHKRYHGINIRLDIPLDDACASIQDIARNVFQAFFKNMHLLYCENCNSRTNNIKQQLQKAHHKGSNRPRICKKILEELAALGHTTVSGDAMIMAFIVRHKEVPIWTLCRQCHRAYDALDK